MVIYKALAMGTGQRKSLMCTLLIVYIVVTNLLLLLYYNTIILYYITRVCICNVRAYLRIIVCVWLRQVRSCLRIEYVYIR